MHAWISLRSFQMIGGGGGMEFILVITWALLSDSLDSALAAQHPIIREGGYSVLVGE